MVFKLAHISDIHLGPLPKVQRRELFSKRITGYINWYRNRAGKMVDGSLNRLVDHLKLSAPDHIAVTGDLVNLALDEEIRLAADWLEKLGAPEFVSVVPGNHDTYVPRALEKIVHAWEPYMTGDTPAKDHHFPYFRRRGPVALIGVNSGRATMPFMATGSFKSEQAGMLTPLLQEAKKLGLFRIVMIHHPPFPNATSAHKRLIGAARFRKLIATEGADLILHGHTHIDSLEWIDGPNGQVPVIGVPSASSSLSLQDQQRPQRHKKPPGRYNIFEISGGPGNWNCQFSEYGYDRPDGTIDLISSNDLAIPN